MPPCCESYCYEKAYGREFAPPSHSTSVGPQLQILRYFMETSFRSYLGRAELQLCRFYPSCCEQLFLPHLYGLHVCRTWYRRAANSADSAMSRNSMPYFWYEHAPSCVLVSTPYTNEFYRNFTVRACYTWCYSSFTATLRTFEYRNFTIYA